MMIAAPQATPQHDLPVVKQEWLIGPAPEQIGQGRADTSTCFGVVIRGDQVLVGLGLFIIVEHWKTQPRLN